MDLDPTLLDLGLGAALLLALVALAGVIHDRRHRTTTPLLDAREHRHGVERSRYYHDVNDSSCA